MSASPTVRLYGNATCPYCGAARMLLTKKGVAFEDISVTSDPDMFTEMQQLSGNRSVPQIFIDDTHVGGFDELSALEQDDELDKLLGK